MGSYVPDRMSINDEAALGGDEKSADNAPISIMPWNEYRTKIQPCKIREKNSRAMASLSNVWCQIGHLQE